MASGFIQDTVPRKINLTAIFACNLQSLCPHRLKHALHIETNKLLWILDTWGGNVILYWTNTVEHWIPNLALHSFFFSGVPKEFGMNIIEPIQMRSCPCAFSTDII